MSKAAKYSLLIICVLVFFLYLPSKASTELEPLLGTARINVKVTNEPGGEGISGAEIYITSAPIGVECECYLPVTTDASGEALIPLTGVPIGPVQIELEASATGFEPVRRTVQIVAFATVDIEIVFRQKLEVRGNGTGNGKVTSFPSGIDCDINQGVESGDCSQTYDFGTEVILSAEPLEDSTFDGWSGSDCGDTGECTVTMNGHQTASARFALCVYLISPTSRFVPIGGGTYSITVTTSNSECDAPWNASENVNWITITSGSSGSGDGTVRYEVSANNGPERTATITVAENNHTVNQTGNSPPTISNPTGALILLSDPICNLYGDPVGSSFQVNFDYSDPDGNGPTNISQAKMSVAWDFPDCCDGSFDNYTWNSSVSGDGYSGTVITKQCYRFGNNSYVDVTMTIEDLIGSKSNPLTVRIEKPLAIEPEMCIPAILHLLID
jgi:hypothetical protein